MADRVMMGKRRYRRFKRRFDRGLTDDRTVREWLLKGGYFCVWMEDEWLDEWVELGEVDDWMGNGEKMFFLLLGIQMGIQMGIQNTEKRRLYKGI